MRNTAIQRRVSATALLLLASLLGFQTSIGAGMVFIEGEWIGGMAQSRQQPIHRVDSIDAELTFTPIPGATHKVECTAVFGEQASWVQLDIPESSPGRLVHSSVDRQLFYRLLVQGGGDAAVPTLGIRLERHLTRILLESYVGAVGFPGWEVRFDMRSPGAPANGWVSLPVEPIDSRGEFYRSSEAPEGAEFRFLARPRFDRGSVDTYVVCGQSNGVVYETEAGPPAPGVVRATYDGRLLPASQYNPTDQRVYQYSFAIEAANTLFSSTGRTNLVCPVSVGSTKMQQWMPLEDRLDASSLYGRANLSRAVWAPGGPRAILYHGHESNTDNAALLATYAEEWRALMAEFKKDFGSTPVVFAQLGKSTLDSVAFNLNRGGGIQTALETDGSGDQPKQKMVVTFDLPLADYIHLSPEGQRLLGQRFALAIRQHVFGQKVDGTGPPFGGHPPGCRRWATDRGPIQPSHPRLHEQLRRTISSLWPRGGDRGCPSGSRLPFGFGGTDSGARGSTAAHRQLWQPSRHGLACSAPAGCPRPTSFARPPVRRDPGP